MAARTRKVPRREWNQALADWWEGLTSFYEGQEEEILGGVQRALTKARAERKAHQQKDSRS